MKQLNDILEKFYNNIGTEKDTESILSDQRYLGYILKHLKKPGRPSDYVNNWTHRYEIMDIFNYMSRKYAFIIKYSNNEKDYIRFIPLQGDEFKEETWMNGKLISTVTQCSADTVVDLAEFYWGCSGKVKLELDV